MKKNYTYYMGSSTKRDFNESIIHVQDKANYLYGKGYMDSPNEKKIDNILSIIRNYNGSVFNAMSFFLGGFYEAQSSLDLLLDSDVNLFKQHAYVAAKLAIMGSETNLAWITGINTSSLFMPIMSDNPELIQFLIKHCNAFEGKFCKSFQTDFFLRNTLLALAGEWDLLKARAEQFLTSPRLKRDEKRVPDHEFYVALANQDVLGMETALNKLLVPKLAKRAVYDNNVWFDFYLQMQVCLYGKIASFHGFELNIDSPMAPKELITYKPLAHYEDPYEFMHEFDFNQPLDDWIQLWESRMEKAKQEEQRNKKKGWFSWFKRSK